MEDKKKILMIDDDMAFVKLVKFHLEKNGYHVLTAYDGDVGLDLANQSAPDLIILDIMMPKMSGFEVCKRIKSDPKTRDIIVVMVTALNEASDIERAAECGTDNYLSKPIERKALAFERRN